jgi:hypothetical protein
VPVRVVNTDELELGGVGNADADPDQAFGKQHAVGCSSSLWFCCSRFNLRRGCVLLVAVVLP